MRRISPRDMVLYLLVILMMLAAVSTLMQMDQAEAPEYSDIRAYFLQRQVESFTLQDNTLTLTLRGEEGPGTGSTITYQVARPDWLYQDLHDVWEEQQADGILTYDIVPGIESTWWYQSLPILVGIALAALICYVFYRQRAAAMGSGGGGVGGRPLSGAGRAARTHRARNGDIRHAGAGAQRQLRAEPLRHFAQHRENAREAHLPQAWRAFAAGIDRPGGSCGGCRRACRRKRSARRRLTRSTF